MKVLLIWPNSLNEVLGWGDLGAIAEPLSLEYLGAGLLERGHEVRLLDLRLHPGTLAAELAAFEPDMVGVTAFSLHVRSAIKICAEVKAWRPSCKTIAGGHHATFLPEDFFEDPLDYVVQGEGVRPIRAVAEALAQGREPQHVPGLWRRIDGEFRCEVPAAEPGRDIDELPVPARSLTASDRERYFIDWMKPVALLRTTLGCPYRCSFCSIWKAMDGRYVKRDIAMVVDELATVKEDWVFLVDDEAFIDQRRMLALAEAIAARGIRKRFFTYCRIDTLLRHTDAVKAWRDIGLERLFVGVDAISSKDLDEYNKKCNLRQIEDGLKLADELGISIFAQFVVNTDYTERDFKRLVRFIEHNRVRYPSFTVLTPLPGTDIMLDDATILERQPNGRPNWDLFDCQNAVMPTTLPKDTFRKEYRNLYRVFKGAYTQYREHNPIISEQEHTQHAALRSPIGVI